jgi:hypothetical protein
MYFNRNTTFSKVCFNELDVAVFMFALSPRA